jgi:hypothetical protein
MQAIGEDGRRRRRRWRRAQPPGTDTDTRHGGRKREKRETRVGGVSGCDVRGEGGQEAGQGEGGKDQDEGRRARIC